MDELPRIDSYKIIKVIGKGSTSIVYLAHTEGNVDDFVAIKVIYRWKLKQQTINNIVTEVTVMEKLKHKHIVEMIDFMWDSEHIFIITEYCDGGELTSFIKKQGSLPETTFLKCMQDLALALQFLRYHCISHLDLKPQNLLIKTTPSLVLKVADFGLMKFMSDETLIHNVCGTPLYMAPEMVLHRTYDYKADLWSVGIIAYECIFGHTPYFSNTMNGVEHLMKKDDFLIEVPQDKVSPEVRDFILSLLKFEPAERIDFNEFFNHSFLKLKEIPSPDLFEKGIESIQQAITFDAKKKYKAAFHKYYVGLLHLISHTQNENDINKKEALKVKIDECMKHAYALQHKITATKTKKLSLKKNLPPISNELRSLCLDYPRYTKAIEITHFGKVYMDEKHYEAAIDKLKIGLLWTEKLLEEEIPTVHYTLLNEQITEWKKMCDEAKTLFQANKSNMKIKKKPRLMKGTYSLFPDRSIEEDYL